MKIIDNIVQSSLLLLSLIAHTSGYALCKLSDPLEAEDWDCSEWISAKNAQVISWYVGWNQREANGANWFVCDIVNEKEVVSAIWMTTALGVYDIYVNQELIGEEVLKPGFSDYAKTKYSFTYDVTDAFNLNKDACNRLSAQVTPGWWADKIITPTGNIGMIGQKCAFRSVLKLTYVDGTSEIHGTDLNNWKAGIAGKVKRASIFGGEIYDDREKEGFDSLELLESPVVNHEFNGAIIPTNGAEVYYRHDLTLSPKLAYTYKDIENASEENFGKVIIRQTFINDERLSVHPGETLIIDFGQNCSAVPHFTFKGEPGTKLTCLPGEILNDGNGAKSRGMDGPEGSVHRKNLRTPDNGMFIEYTFGNTPSYVDYLPRCSFFGYRYIAVSADNYVEISQVSSIPISSLREEMEIGLIETGNHDINQLLRNTLWSQRSNYLSIPSDCPNRNERLGWLADTQIFCETGTYFADVQKFFHKWLRDVRDSQLESGAYPVVAPVGCQGKGAMCCGWSDAGIIVPYMIYKQYGDGDIIRKHWDSMQRYMDHIKDTDYDYDRLTHENNNYVFGDWLSFEPLEVHSEKHVGEDGEILPEAKEYWNYLSQSYWLMDSRIMKIMATAIGNNEAIEKYQLLEGEISNKIKNRYFTSDGHFRCEVLNTMQTPALFALMNDIFEGSTKESLAKRLKDNFKARGNSLTTGFLGTSILMNTLTENGLSDIAYDLLFQHNNPSWLYSIDNGATTIWERWDSYTVEKGMAPSGMNSFNHYAYGSVCEWIWKSCAGISADPLEPGFKHIILKPIPDERLGYIKTEYQSPNGLIKSAWKYEGDKWIWEFTIPEGATACVTIPGETKSAEYTSGTYSISLTLSNSVPEYISVEKDIVNTEGETVIVSKEEHEMVDIYNMQGIKVFSTQNNSFRISSFPHGVYIIKVGEKYERIMH